MQSPICAILPAKYRLNILLGQKRSFSSRKAKLFLPGEAGREHSGTADARDSMKLSRPRVAILAALYHFAQS